MIVNRGIFRVPPESAGGGAEKHGYDLANQLANLGHEVHFVGKIGARADFNPLVRIHRVPPRRGVIPPQTALFGWLLKHLGGNTLTFFVAFRTLIKENFRFDVIHCHGALAALLLSISTVHRVPVVYTMQDPSPWIATYDTRVERLVRKVAYFVVDVPCLRCVSHVIAVSPSLSDEAKRLGVKSSKVMFIPNAVLPPSHEPRKRKPKHGLFVGQLVKRKGVDVLLESVNKLRTKEVHFTIIGDGPEKPKLEKLARSLRLSDRVVFTGYLYGKKLAHYFLKASFFAFPSTAEGLPISCIEAMACGLPVIASRLPVYEGTLQDGRNALLFEPRNSKQLADCINKLLADRKLAEKLSLNGRRLVERVFSWDVVVRQITSVYNRQES